MRFCTQSSVKFLEVFRAADPRKLFGDKASAIHDVVNDGMGVRTFVQVIFQIFLMSFP